MTKYTHSASVPLYTGGTHTHIHTQREENSERYSDVFDMLTRDTQEKLIKKEDETV